MMKHEINERIKIFREYKSIKQSLFAKLIGVSRSTLSEIENQKNYAPSTQLIIGIANAFDDINIEWLLTGKGEMLKNDIENSQIEIKQIIEKIEPMNNKQRREILKIIIDKQYINELENLVKELTTNNNL